MMRPVDARWLRVTEVVRYSRDADRLAVEVDGYLNFHHLTRAPNRDDPGLLLESGINRVAPLAAVDGSRRPVIAIRSSPWKAGHESNPWHDEFDLDHGHVRYFGDHKPTTVGSIGATPGNRALLEAWRLHQGTSRAERAAATPLVLFRSQTVTSGSGRRTPKGHVEFCGVGIIERLEHVVQRDPSSGRSFPNIALDINVIDLADAGDQIDWRWIDDRRDADLTNDDALRHAPSNWRRWVENGRAVLPAIRRRVLVSRVHTAAEQMPVAGSSEDFLLRDVYAYFEGRKHSFERLAARVAAQVLGTGGASYTDGWLTRAGGDGGVDFVARLDLGSGDASTPMVVLGQAKCVTPGVSISAEQVARVVARLQRGWVGVYVTTGVFSRQAQIEIIDDRYPIVLVPGKRLAEEVRRMAYASYGGDTRALLEATADEYSTAITFRRPEEVLNA
jgi:hypothetical protein